jgi:hypothetical protein
MEIFQSEEVIERGIASIAAALNQKAPSEATVNVWKELFRKENAHRLAMCFRRLLEESEKFPSPRRMRSLVAEFKPSGNPALTHTEGFDKDRKPCWFWSDAPTVPAYLAADCDEGRACRAKLRELCGATNKLLGTKEEKARRAELQSQKVQILSGKKRVREPGDDG